MIQPLGTIAGMRSGRDPIAQLSAAASAMFASVVSSAARGAGSVKKAVKAAAGAAAYPFIGYRPYRVAPEVWEQEFNNGDWDRLGRLDHIGGLASVFAYVQFFAPRSILDVGCATGLLAQRLSVLDFEDYDGIDISAKAIAQAQEACPDSRMHFSVEDATAFSADRKYDSIIFSQCLAYLDEPGEIVRRYAEQLTANGRIIVSLADHPRTRACFSQILRHVIAEDVTMVSQGRGRTRTMVLVPKQRKIRC